MAKPQTIGNLIAPWRFIVFFIVLALVGVFCVWWFADNWLAALAGFDAAAAIFILLHLPLLGIRDASVIEDLAAKNDGNRTLLLGLTGVVMTVLLIAVGTETVGQRPEPVTKILIIGTLIFAWLFSNTVYALHYAHMAYVSPGDGCQGIQFPDTPLPVYWDFVYFAFTLGMTFQTSDVVISGARMRRVVTIHTLAAFFFNIGVLAFTINVLGSD
jgi:uncharacterized membrane protein